MSVPTAAIAALAVLMTGAGCRTPNPAPVGQTDSATIASRETRLAQALAHGDSGADREKPLARWLLAPELSEISGLALTADGRLLTHEDEDGTVWEIDYRRGVIVKRFRLGPKAVRGDFESIAVADGSVFLFTSKGHLYQFHEGAAGARVDFRLHKTGLGDECEFEGMAFDPAIASLMLACKIVRTRTLRDSLVIYRWSLQDGDDQRPSRLTVPLAKAIGANGWKTLHPSDITVDPASGNYVLIASREKALIEITPAGEVVFSRPLPGEHEQPEGIAITKDSILIVSDEQGGSKAAVITLYRWPLTVKTAP